MRKVSLRSARGLMLILVALMGFMGLTASPAGAQTTGCVPEENRAFFALVDPTKGDGMLTISDMRTIAGTLPEGNPQRVELERLIAQAEQQGLTGLRYDLTGPCPPPATATTAPTNAPATSTTAPATSTTAPGTATTVPATSTTAPATSTTVPGTETATTVPGTETATTVPGTETATAAATTVPATTAPDDDGDDDVSELPDTGQGPADDQGNATLVMLLGGMALCIGGAFLWTQRRAS